MTDPTPRPAPDALREARLSQPSPRIRVGEEEDEVVAYGYIHVERMSDKHIWANLGGVSFDFAVVKGKLVWTAQEADGWAGIERDLTGQAHYQQSAVRAAAYAEAARVVEAQRREHAHWCTEQHGQIDSCACTADVFNLGIDAALAALARTAKQGEQR